MQQTIHYSHRDELEKLKKSIRLQKKFSLFIAGFSQELNRDKLIEEVNETFQNSFIVEITKDNVTNFDDFERRLAALSKKNSVIHLIYNHISLFDETSRDFFNGLNYHREKIAEENPVSVIIWMLAGNIREFVINAPDIWAWRAGVFHFELSDYQSVSSHPDDAAPGKQEAKHARIKEIHDYLTEDNGLEGNTKALLYHELGELYFSTAGNNRNNRNNRNDRWDNYKKARDYVRRSLALYRLKSDSRLEMNRSYKMLRTISQAIGEDTKAVPAAGNSGKPYKILVIDDEPHWQDLITGTFQNEIQEKEWKFIFSKNGNEALEKVSKHPDIGVILLDIYMPGMDGLMFLKELNNMQTPLARKTIIISANDSRENIRAAMNNGAFDFLTKPVDFEALTIAIKKSISSIDAFRDALESYGRLKTTEKELAIAADIQQAMLPQTFPAFPYLKEFDIYAKMIPAHRVGGDFYDFFFIDREKERLAFSVGDVSGKGIPAALYMTKCCSLLKTAAMQTADPGECLRKLNNLLAFKSAPGMFVTLFYGILNIATGDVQYSCGGAEAPYIIRSNGKVRQPVPHQGGICLGLAYDREYKVGVIKLEKGDTIFLNTDGVPKAANSQKILFADNKKRFPGCLEGTAKLPVEDITEGLIIEIKEFTADSSQRDDIALLAMRYNG
ncbi:MAG: SpoIIE family protein phosphatase [bacterium]|nr:SpoIIE family protein phosphatase [bacterium]